MSPTGSVESPGREGKQPDRGRPKAGKQGSSQLSPMMRQFERAKQEAPDALLFFRMGDF